MYGPGMMTPDEARSRLQVLGWPSCVARAKLRAEALGWPSVSRFIKTRLGATDRRDKNCIVTYSNIQAGVKTRRAMESLGALFGVDPTYWLTSNIEAVIQEALAPREDLTYEREQAPTTTTKDAWS